MIDTGRQENPHEKPRRPMSTQIIPTIYPERENPHMNNQLQVNVETPPHIGAVLDVMTSKTPEIETMVEIMKDKKVCAVGIVTEVTGKNSYQVLVIA
jgi:hypothetical protein